MQMYRVIALTIREMSLFSAMHETQPFFKPQVDVNLKTYTTQNCAHVC